MRQPIQLKSSCGTVISDKRGRGTQWGGPELIQSRAKRVRADHPVQGEAETERRYLISSREPDAEAILSASHQPLYPARSECPDVLLQFATVPVIMKAVVDRSAFHSCGSFFFILVD